MSDTQSYSTAHLLSLLDQIKESILADELSKATQKDIWDVLHWDKDNPQHKEMIKYLFTGWWIHQQMNLTTDYSPSPNSK